MRTWEADVEVDCGIAHRIVSAQFPKFVGLTPQFLGRGWDNFCVEYSNGTVFRLPTRKEGAQILLNEVAVLPALADLLPVRIPELLYQGHPDDKYPYRFIGYSKIPGRTADQLVWSPFERAAAAPVLGQCLRVLHGIDASRPPFSELPGDHTGKADPGKLLDRMRSRFEQLKDASSETRSLLRDALRLAGELAARPVTPAKTCVVHGDFYPRHILADDSHRVSGIIDWGDVHFGDPAIDLSIAYTFFEPHEWPQFWAAYGGAPDTGTIQIIILRASMYGFALLAYGLEEGDEAAAAMGESILRRVLAG